MEKQTEQASKTYAKIAPRKHPEHQTSLLGGTRSTQNQRKIAPRTLPGSQGPPGVYRRVAMAAPGGGKGSMFGDFGGPAGIPKSTKNGSGSKKVCPETSPEAFFIGFPWRCRSESLCAPILARFFTENHARIKGAFSRKHLFFLDGATSRIVCNLHIEAHFFMF